MHHGQAEESGQQHGSSATVMKTKVALTVYVNVCVCCGYLYMKSVNKFKCIFILTCTDVQTHAH